MPARTPVAQLPAPELTVRYDGSAHTFVAGDDVVIGRDIHADYASLRSRIGMVPQDDVLLSCSANGSPPVG
jgi:hypothetical protein